MALSKEELNDIKTGVNVAKKKSMAFAYAKTRKDGAKDPLLLIDKTTSLVKKGIMAQGGKPHSLGKLLMQDEGEQKGRLTFVVEKGKAKDIEQGMKLGLKKAHPLLNKAAFLMEKDFSALQDQIAAAAAAAKADAGAEKAKSKKAKDAEAKPAKDPMGAAGAKGMMAAGEDEEEEEDGGGGTDPAMLAKLITARNGVIRLTKKFISMKDDDDELDNMWVRHANTVNKKFIGKLPKYFRSGKITREDAVTQLINPVVSILEKAQDEIPKKYNGKLKSLISWTRGSTKYIPKNTEGEDLGL